MGIRVATSLVECDGVVVVFSALALGASCRRWSSEVRAGGKRLRCAARGIGTGGEELPEQADAPLQDRERTGCGLRAGEDREDRRPRRDQTAGSRDVGDFAKWAKKMGRQYDGALGSDFGQLAAKAENGEDPVERIDAAHTLRYRMGKAFDEATRPKRDDGPPPSDDPYRAM